MLGASGWIFSQFLSPTIEPPVARVSAARATPSYINLWLVFLCLRAHNDFTYCKYTTTDRCTCLGELKLLVRLEVRFKSLVSEAVVVVKAAKRQVIHIIEFHDVRFLRCSKDVLTLN